MCFQRGRCCETGIEALKATFRNERRDEVNPFLDIGEGEDSYCTSSDETDAEVNDGQSESDLESDADVDGSRSGSGAEVDDGMTKESSKRPKREAALTARTLFNYSSYSV